MNTNEHIREAYVRGFGDAQGTGKVLSVDEQVADLLEDERMTKMEYELPETDLVRMIGALCDGNGKTIRGFDGYYTLEHQETGYTYIRSNGEYIIVVSDHAQWLAEEVLGLRPESERQKPFIPNRDGLAWKLLNKGQRKAVETSEGTYTITLSYDARGGYDLWCNHVCLLERGLDTDAAEAFAEDLGLTIQRKAQIRASCVQGQSTEYNLFLDGKEIFSSSDKGEVLAYALRKGLEVER